MKRNLTLKLLTAFLGIVATTAYAKDKPLPVGSPFPLADGEFEDESLRELLESPTFVSEEKEIDKALGGTLHVGPPKADVRCRLSKSMLNFLLNMSRKRVPLQGRLVYAGGQHALLYRDPETDLIACVNNAIDVTKVNGKQVLYVDPEATRDAIVGLLHALPPGTYELGLPRQPYANGERGDDNVSLAGVDIIRYFVPKNWTWLYKEDPNQPLKLPDNKLNPERFQLNDGNVDSYRYFYTWASNTNILTADDLKSSTSRLWRYLGGSTPSDEQNAMRTRMVQGFDGPDGPERTRSMIQNRRYANDIAVAMEEAKARGVNILGTYGDALDHIHIEDLKVESPDPPATRDTSTLTLEYDTNYIGRDYTSYKLPKPDWKNCANRCEKDARCEAYTFVPVGIQDPSSAICWLKSGVSMPTDQEDYVSGVRKKIPGLEAIVMHNIDLMGSDYQRFLAGGYKECARACDRDNSCKAFTFVQAGVQEASAVCYLKNSIPKASANMDTISGMKTRITLPDVIKFIPFEIIPH